MKRAWIMWVVVAAASALAAPLAAAEAWSPSRSSLAAGAAPSVSSRQDPRLLVDCDSSEPVARHRAPLPGARRAAVANPLAAYVMLHRRASGDLTFGWRPVHNCGADLGWAVGTGDFRQAAGSTGGK